MSNHEIDFQPFNRTAKHVYTYRRADAKTKKYGKAKTKSITEKMNYA